MASIKRDFPHGWNAAKRLGTTWHCLGSLDRDTRSSISGCGSPDLKAIEIALGAKRGMHFEVAVPESRHAGSTQDEVRKVILRCEESRGV